MSNQQLPSSPRVTLEDLLRIKRAERPPAEFWADFERNLRSKQLAAIVEKRPWWASGRFFSSTRWSVPLGGVAALALTFAVVGPSYQRSASQGQSALPGIAAVPHEVSAPPFLASNENSLVSAAPSLLSSSPAIDKNHHSAMEIEVQPVRAVVIPEATAPVQLASVTEQIAGIGREAEVDYRQKSDTARFASSDQQDFTGELGALFQFAVATLDLGMRSERVAAVEPLSQVPTPRDARRARLLAFTSSVDTNSPQYSDSSNVIRSRDRIANHLNEDALYDSIRRLGIKDGGVSIQF